MRNHENFNRLPQQCRQVPGFLSPISQSSCVSSTLELQNKCCVLSWRPVVSRATRKMSVDLFLTQILIDCDLISLAFYHLVLISCCFLQELCTEWRQEFQNLCSRPANEQNNFTMRLPCMRLTELSRIHPSFDICCSSCRWRETMSLNCSQQTACCSSHKIRQLWAWTATVEW
jgi:hypothetical protein